MLRADGKLPQRRDHIPLGILVLPGSQDVMNNSFKDHIIDHLPEETGHSFHLPAQKDQLQTMISGSPPQTVKVA